MTVIMVLASFLLLFVTVTNDRRDP